MCPGCGLSLPAAAGLPVPRFNASPECWRVYGEVTGPAMTDPVLGELHQLTVDTYAAHHPRAGSPPIGTAFALIGLYLSLERGMSGPRVRDEHHRLARVRRSWPEFVPPPGLDALSHSILDVDRAVTNEAHARALDAWAGAVWHAWGRHHGLVAELYSDPPRAVG